MMHSPPDPALRFCAIFADGSGHLISDLRAQVAPAFVAGKAVPVTLADRADAPNGYLVCPSVAYIDYAIEETRAFTHALLLRTSLNGLIRAARPVLRATGLDHQVQVNNWLLSTNHTPDVPPDAVLGLMRDMAAAYPDRAVTLRSLNDQADLGLLTVLAKGGAVLLPARQVWLWTAERGACRRNVRRDAEALRTTPLTRVAGHTFTPEDFATAAALYGQLYLQKYTPLNPHYTPAYLEAMHRAGLMRLTGLRDRNGALVGVLGTVSLNGLLTAPIVGYRTDLPQALGLYRLLIACAMDQARAENLPLNISAGAADFKRNRGAMAAIEYTAVLVNHLPLPNRLATAMLAALLTRVGLPIMRRYGL